MQQDMRVLKHKTVESEETQTEYTITLVFASVEAALKSRISRLNIVSTDADIFEKYPLNELVTVKVSKPQQKLDE